MIETTITIAREENMADEANTADAEPAAAAPEPVVEPTAAAIEQAGGTETNAKPALEAVDDPKKSAEREQAFTLFEQATKRADWGYKVKTGDERELGHKSVVLAENAFIAAAVHDDKRASDLYEKATGRPPKPELMERVGIAREQGHRTSIADLTAGIARIGKQRDMHVLKAEAGDIEKKMGSWNDALRDAHDKGVKHRRDGHEELLNGEKHRDDGMHLFSAFRSGLRASHSYRQMGAERKKKKELTKIVVDHHHQHRGILSSLAHFHRTEGTEPATGAATKGPTGIMVGRFQGAVAKATQVIVKAVEKQAQPEVAGVAQPDRGMSAAAKAGLAAMGQGLDR